MSTRLINTILKTRSKMTIKTAETLTLNEKNAKYEIDKTIFLLLHSKDPVANNENPYFNKKDLDYNSNIKESSRN